MAFPNQLEALKSMSLVVADSGDLEKVKKYKPTDCTTNPSLVLKVVQMDEYKHFLSDAIKEESSNETLKGHDRPYSSVADRITVNMGCELLKIIPGRVSTEVDANLSYDTQALINKGRRLIELYESKGVDKSRVYIKLASTWEGICACKVLQDEGIDCNMTLMFSFAQGVACANAKATLCSPFVGRILDYYKKKNDREYSATEDPGVLAVKRVYNYYKKYGAGTIVMAASFRTIGEIQELAGIDNITISPTLLEELENIKEELPRKLSTEQGAADCQDEEFSNMDEELFRKMHGEDDMAVEKLKTGIEGFVDAQTDLESLLNDLAKKDEKVTAA